MSNQNGSTATTSAPTSLIEWRGKHLTPEQAWKAACELFSLLPGDYIPSPWKPGERTLAEIEADLHREIPPRFLGSKTKGGRSFTVYTWMTTQRFLSYFAPGWSGHATLTFSGERVGCVYELSIPTSDSGVVSRSASGDDSEDDDEADKPTDPAELRKWEQEQKGRQFGTPTTRAEGQAFKRAAARFGFGMYLRKS